MTENIAQFDTVRIPGGIPENDVPEGALATVLDVYTDPYLAYEIEVVDLDGRTLYVGVVDPSWVELVKSYGHGDCRSEALAYLGDSEWRGRRRPRGVL